MSIVFLTTSLPDASVGVFYSQPIQVTGGHGVCTFFVTSGQLPPGLALVGAGAGPASLVSSISTDLLAASQVLVQGTPTTAGTFTFTILARDKQGNSASQVYTINVGVVLDAFDLPTFRKTKDGTQNLWSAYLTVNTDQTVSLDTVKKAFKNVIGDSVMPQGTGTSTGGNTSTTLNDTTQNWTSGQFGTGPSGNGNVYLTGGTGAGQVLEVLNNTATQITLQGGSWNPVPDATTTYKIRFPISWYVQFEPNGSVDGYSYPNGYAGGNVEYGKFDPNCNRFTFWFKSGGNMTRRADGGSIGTVANYIRAHDETDLSNQGNHYYWQFTGNLYANRWHYFVMNRLPNHQVGYPDNDFNWPEDPSFVQGFGTVVALTGTVSVTGNPPSAIVTGSGTSFLSQVTAGGVGGWIQFSQDPVSVAYHVLSVQSNTQLTLATNYQGNNASGLTANVGFPIPTVEDPADDGPTPSVSQDYVHFFDGLTRWYFEWNGVFQFADGLFNSTCYFTDVQFDKQLNAPDDIVSAIQIVYNGTAYEVTWSGTKDVQQNYTVYSSTAGTMRNADGSYNGTGTSQGTVHSPGNAFTGCFLTTAAMAEQSQIWFVIAPQGRTQVTEVKMFIHAG